MLTEDILTALFEEAQSQSIGQLTEHQLQSESWLNLKIDLKNVRILYKIADISQAPLETHPRFINIQIS